MPFTLITAGLGLVVGSFITALVPRLASNETFLKGRSRCVQCRKTLGWFELVPVLSFLIQGGRCRSCGGKIPLSYPLIELAAALAFTLTAWGTVNSTIAPPPFLKPGELASGFTYLDIAVFLYYAIFAALGIAIAYYDLENGLIPTAIVYSLSGFGLAAQLTGALRSGAAYPFILGAAVAAGAFLLFWALWRFSGGRAMGRGDADAALAIGLALTPATALLAFLFAFWSGAAFGIILVIAGRMSWKSRIPFGPFLFLGAWLAWLAAPSLTAYFILATLVF